MKGENETARSPELERAIRDYLNARAPEALERIVRYGKPLVNYFASLYSPGNRDEDLEQAGYEGLLKAVKRFDPAREVLFVTYASHCIIGEVRRELRRRSVFKVPQWLTTLQAAVIRATDELLQENGTMPTLPEIAAKVNVSEAGIVEAMQAGALSLNEIDFNSIKSLRYESFKLPLEDLLTVRMALEKLGELPRKVLTLIFYQDMTQSQVAAQLGTNQRRVSRILNRGLATMRKAVS